MEKALTMRIAKDYQAMAVALPHNGLQDIGERRRLRVELQERCGLTELEALNTLNGFHVQDYIAAGRKRMEEEERRKEEKREEKDRDGWN